MTLRLQPIHAPDTSKSLPVRIMTSGRDPRAALFVIGLVAASPSGTASALAALARRLTDRHSGNR